MFYSTIFGLGDGERPSDAVISNDAELDAWIEKRKFDKVQQIPTKQNSSNAGKKYKHPAALFPIKKIGG